METAWDIIQSAVRPWVDHLPAAAWETAARLWADTAGDGVFPPRDQVFRALALTPPEAVRVVILGQDPYPTAGHANGLCFSVNPDVSPLPPSLRNILKEYTADLGFPAPRNGDLSPWAGRGVLLLNAVLTVPEGTPGGHRRLGWQTVTAAVLEACLALPQSVVFLLWGRDAQAAYDRALSHMETRTGGGAPPESGRVSSAGSKFALRSSHPSPLGAGKPCGGSPHFLGSRPFSSANALLGADAVDWRLPAAGETEGAEHKGNH